jgi:kynurenine formamidase
MKHIVAMTAALLVLGVAGAAKPPQAPSLLEAYEPVDLTHPLGAETIYWPTSPIGFELKTLSKGMTEGGWFYAANSFCAAEHGGTHLDAPGHFSASGDTAEKISLDRLIAPVVVLDISPQCSGNPDYQAAAGDVQAFEARHGKIRRGSIVLLRTGWSRRWPDRKAYLGDDRKGDASNLHFPGFGKEAARVLIEERGAAALGLDTASLDPGNSKDFQVHRLAAARNVPGLENLKDLEKLPPTGAWLFALPLKIEGGTGSPLRVVAMVPRR